MLKSYLKVTGLISSSIMKGFYTSSIGRNMYCKDGPLKSLSFFFLIYYKLNRFCGNRSDIQLCRYHISANKRALALIKF